jgi:EmrB/QacA subfamily drug resistance transporter
MNEAPAVREGAPTRGVALLVAGALFMENLDGTVMTTALPDMARALGARPVDLASGISAYMLALAVFIPISGWVADRFGPRPVFTAAVATFTVASALCGLSRTVPQFTAARVLQGIGGAMMVPVGRLVVLRSTEKRDLVRAIAILTWPGLVAPILGPPVGGFITTWWGWRWIFFVNLPLGIAAVALALALIRGLQGERRPLDVLGFVLAGTACTGLLVALEDVGRAPAGRVVATLALGGAALASTIVHLRRAPHPLVDLSAVRVPTFKVTLRGGSFSAVAVLSAPFLLPLLFQLGLGLTPIASGSLLLALFAGNLAMKPSTTWLLRTFGFRTVLVANGVLVAAGFLACALIGPRTPHAIIAALLFATGLFRSMQFTAFSTLGFADIPAARMSAASTLFSAMRQLNAGIGVALGAVTLAIAQALRGRGGAQVEVADFRIAFLLVAGVSAVALVDSWKLPPDAGAEVSGHVRNAHAPAGAGGDREEPRR